VPVAGNGFDASTDYLVVMMSLSVHLLIRRGDRSFSPAVACAARSGSPAAARPPFPLRWGRAAVSPNTRSRMGGQGPAAAPVQRAPGHPFADWLAAFAVRSDSRAWPVMYSKYSFESNGMDYHPIERQQRDYTQLVAR
jgi:hypothetical protein